MKVFLVFGTRPEAIKMCPLVLQLKRNDKIKCVVCLTGQHKEMLDQVMETFGVEADYNLNIMKADQTLTGITISILDGLAPILISEAPDLVLVHGDTTTSYAAALAAFYQKIPVGHVEAGLRTGNIYSPYPEEMNRLLTDRISTYYFAPTEKNKQNLIKEGEHKNIFVTGNTVVDAFAYTVKDDYQFHNEALRLIEFKQKKVIILTAHRRENLGEPLRNICNAVKRITEIYKNVVFVYPVHMNPRVRKTVFEILLNNDGIILIDPIDVLDMHNLMARCFMVMTDSGGIQEEAPHFGKPVLVLREETERPEAVEAGTVKVVGTDTDVIIKNVQELLDNKKIYEKMAKAINPYGDGHACERILKAIEDYI